MGRRPKETTITAQDIKAGGQRRHVAELLKRLGHTDVDLDSIIITYRPPYRPQVDTTAKTVSRMLKGVIAELKMNGDRRVTKAKLSAIARVSRQTLYDLIERRILIFPNDCATKGGIELSEVYNQLMKS